MLCSFIHWCSRLLLLFSSLSFLRLKWTYYFIYSFRNKIIPARYRIYHFLISYIFLQFLTDVHSEKCRHFLYSSFFFKKTGHKIINRKNKNRTWNAFMSEFTLWPWLPPKINDHQSIHFAFKSLIDMGFYVYMRRNR